MSEKRPRHFVRAEKNRFSRAARAIVCVNLITAAAAADVTSVYGPSSVSVSIDINKYDAHAPNCITCNVRVRRQRQSIFGSFFSIFFFFVVPRVLVPRHSRFDTTCTLDLSL